MFRKDVSEQIQHEKRIFFSFRLAFQPPSRAMDEVSLSGPPHTRGRVVAPQVW